MKYYIILASLVIITILSCQEQEQEQTKNRVITFYKNNLTPNVEIGISNYTAKIENFHEKPIIIPFVAYHQLPIQQNFITEIKGDSVINLGEMGSIFHPGTGFDTLYKGETQKYFVEMNWQTIPRSSNSYNFISFSYYFLEDYNKGLDDIEIIQNDFFLIYKDSSKVIHIYETIEGFNAFIDKSHPILHDRGRIPRR